ncbi:hypothetical protein ON010_g390 [Phytophthora cinnamomi]|nr:hypothetical protein ON010_g390 [Phytophthora cinnamomi]
MAASRKLWTGGPPYRQHFSSSVVFTKPLPSAAELNGAKSWGGLIRVGQLDGGDGEKDGSEEGELGHCGVGVVDLNSAREIGE